MVKVAYVSSTYQDLKPYREAVYRVLAKMKFQVTAMEDYVARDNRMVEQVLTRHSRNQTGTMPGWASNY